MTKQNCKSLLFLAALGVMAGVGVRLAQAQTASTPAVDPLVGVSGSTTTQIQDSNNGLGNTVQTQISGADRAQTTAVGNAINALGTSANGTFAANPNVGSSINGTTTTDGSIMYTTLEVGAQVEAAAKDGVIRILVPTATDAAHISDTEGAWNAGTPLQGAFVIDKNASGDKVPAVTCPADTANITFGTPTMNLTGVFYDASTNTELTVTQAAAMTDKSKLVRYLAFSCPYTGDGEYLSDVFTAGSRTDGGVSTANAIRISGLINPVAEKDNENVQEAVTIPGKIQFLTSEFKSDAAAAATTASDMSTYAAATKTSAGYRVSEYDVMISTTSQEVLVKARIDYQIAFQILGVEKGDKTVCAEETTNGTTVASTPLLVDYGMPTTGVPVYAAQKIWVNSSAQNGYKVTVAQNSNMTRQDITVQGATDRTAICNGTGSNGTTVTTDGVLASGDLNRDCIPNFGWDKSGGALAVGTADTWASGQTGLGFTVKAAPAEERSLPAGAIRGTASAGSSDDGDYFSTGTKYARFPTRTGRFDYQTATTTADNFKTIAYSDGVGQLHMYDVCYKLVLDAQNNAGVYDNEIVYTITASL